MIPSGSNRNSGRSQVYRIENVTKTLTSNRSSFYSIKGSIIVDYLIKDEKLELKHEPGKGAWTYHIQIPDTKHIVGKWGYLKVSGSIDGYQLESKNLFTNKGQDKLLSVNSEIRKAINKGGGDVVTVSLYLLVPEDQITEKLSKHSISIWNT